MKETIQITRETGHRLRKYKAYEGFKTYDEAIGNLLDEKVAKSWSV